LIIRLSFFCSALVIVIELGLGYVRYQFEVGPGRPLLWSVVSGELLAMDNVAEESILSRRQIEQKLCADSNELLESISSNYSFYFNKLIDAIKQSGAAVVVIYIPVYGVQGLQCKNVFYRLAKQVGVELIDMSGEFSRYESELIYLLPGDNHMSRLGHQLIAKRLFEYLQTASTKNLEVLQIDKSKGLFKINTNKIRVEMSGRPYRLITNAQGYRMDEAISSYKSRVLVLGDSFTYGAHISNEDIYTSILNKAMYQKQVINAGMSGYSIDREWQYYQQHARFLAADVVIIQVSDNDLSDFMECFRSESNAINNMK